MSSRVEEQIRAEIVEAGRRMYERGFDPHNIALAISAGEVIVSYPDDRPFPSVLLLGVVEIGRAHV